MVLVPGQRVWFCQTREAAEREEEEALRRRLQEEKERQQQSEFWIETQVAKHFDWAMYVDRMPNKSYQPTASDRRAAQDRIATIEEQEREREAMRRRQQEEEAELLRRRRQEEEYQARQWGLSITDPYSGDTSEMTRGGEEAEAEEGGTGEMVFFENGDFEVFVVYKSKEDFTQEWKVTFPKTDKGLEFIWDKCSNTDLELLTEFSQTSWDAADATEHEERIYQPTDFVLVEPQNGGGMCYKLSFLKSFWEADDGSKRGTLPEDRRRLDERLVQEIEKRFPRPPTFSWFGGYFS